jgi:hypothetical protein
VIAAAWKLLTLVEVIEKYAGRILKRTDGLFFEIDVKGIAVEVVNVRAVSGSANGVLGGGMGLVSWPGERLPSLPGHTAIRFVHTSPRAPSVWQRNSRFLHYAVAFAPAPVGMT